jgi:hypothetical protein
MRRTVATRSIGRGLARIEPDVGTLVVYSAKDGEIALNGTEDQNPPAILTLCLLFTGTIAGAETADRAGGR